MNDEPTIVCRWHIDHLAICSGICGLLTDTSNKMRFRLDLIDPTDIFVLIEAAGVFRFGSIVQRCQCVLCSHGGRPTCISQVNAVCVRYVRNDGCCLCMVDKASLALEQLLAFGR